MIINCFIFDWNSFWINIIAGLIFLVLSILVSTWLIPKFTIRLIRKRNKKYSITKISALLQELCEFISESPFRDKDLNSEHISVFTKKKDLKNYRFVAICNINVFNKIVFPQMSIKIYDYYESHETNESYKLITDELNRLREFRIEIERILMVHSLHIEEDIIQKISNLCLDIKALESKYKFNLEYDKLIKECREKEGTDETEIAVERNGIFGISEIPKIYENLLQLIKELISLNFFEYKIENTN
jgi:CRISPR/Cas system-associated endonuclease Cas3-HD